MTTMNQDDLDRINATVDTLSALVAQGHCNNEEWNYNLCEFHAGWAEGAFAALHYIAARGGTLP